MVFIDYPPGGLGNFVAQVLTNNIGQENHVSFHRAKNQSYDATLALSSQELFLKALSRWQPRYPVAIGHSWGALDQLKSHCDCQVFSIRVVQRWPELFLNVYNKAMIDCVSANKNPSWNECNNFYDYMLAKFDFDRASADVIIEFDNFYGSQNQFFNEVKKINSTINVQVVYQKFLKTQQPIINQLKYLKDLNNDNNQTLVNFEKVLVTRLQNKTSIPQNPSKVHGLDC